MSHPEDNSAIDDIRAYEYGRGYSAATVVANGEIVGLRAALTIAQERGDTAEAALRDHMALPAPAGHSIAPEEPEEPEPTGFAPRFYVTQQVSSVAEIRSKMADFEDAEETVEAANGRSIRFPWKAYEADKNIATAGRPTTLPHYALRSMAGKHTPTAKMGRTITENGTTYPSPFGDAQGNPNTVFLDHLEAHYRELAAILDATDEVDPILQWTWYAKEWAEIYHGPAVRAAQGYTVDKFIDAHKALIDRAAAVQRDFPGVVMGLQLSGHGPIAGISAGRVLVDELVEHAATVFEPGRAIIHANGWSYRGQWGQSDPDVDETMDAAFEAAHEGGLYVGMQAIQPWGQNATYPQYTAQQVALAFAQADVVGTKSIELYMPSFLSRNGGAVWATPTANWLNA